MAPFLLRLTKGSELTHAELDENQSILLISASQAYRSSSISGTTLKLFSNSSTGSISSITHSLEITSASYSVSASYATTASYAISASHEIILETSSSHAIFADSASFFAEGLVTASISNSTLTFTKDNGDTFDVVIDTGSGENNHVSNVVFSNPSLQFTATGSGFSGDVDISGVVTSGRVVSGLVSATSISPSDKSTIKANISINDTTGSFYDSSSIDENRIKLFYNQSSSFHLLTVDTGSGGTTDTGSLLTTASATNNTLTFTKGDSNTFDVIIDTGSLKDGLISSSAQIADEISGSLNGPSGSFLTTASVSNNDVTFTKGDGTTFTLTVDTGSGATIDTGSFYTGSTVTGNTITFQQGDGTSEIRTIYIDTGSLIHSASLSGSSTDTIHFYRSGAADLFVKINTGSIADDGDQYIENVTYQTGSLRFTRGAVPGQPFDGELNLNSLTSSLYYSSSVELNTITLFKNDGNHTLTVDTGSGGTTDTGSLLTTASATNNVVTFTKGDSTTFDVTIDTGSLPNGLLSSSAQIASDISGSLNGPSGSFITSASVSNNDITFTKGDSSTFTITVDTGSGQAYDLNISGDSGTGVITDAETLSVVGTGGVTTSMSGNQLSIDGNGIFSGSATGTSQGQLKLNGVNYNVKDLQTNSSPTFDNLTVTNTLTTNELVSNIVSQSIALATGSTIFGDQLIDKHQFTGSVEITGSISVQGTSLIKDIQRDSTHLHKLDVTRADGTAYELEIDTGSAGEDGTVTTVGGINGLTGTVTTSGSIQPDYLSNTTNIILAAGASGSDPTSTDEIIFNDNSNDVKYVKFGNIPLSSMNDDLNHGVTSVGYSDGLTGSASPITSTGTLRVKYSGDANVILAANDDQGNSIGSTDYILTSNQSNNDVEFHLVSDLPFTNNNGTVTSVATTGGIKGGTITSAGTISLDYTTTADNNFVMSASTITSAEDGDHILIADNSDSDIVRKITRANFVSGIGGSVTSVGTNNGLTGGTITATGTIGLDLSGSDNYIFAGADGSGGDNIHSSSVIAYSYNNTVRHAFVAELPFTNNAGDITGVNVSQGLTGGGSSGTVSIKPDWSGSADNTLYSYPARVTSIDDDDIVPFHDDSHGTDRTITFANFKNSVGGDITRVNISTGTGITGAVDTTSGDHTQTIGLDLSELTDMTAAVDGNQDEMILLDASVQKRKRLSEINLGQFNNDQGWTSNSGDITGVTAGLGLSGGGSSGTVTLNVSSSNFTTVGSAVDVDLTQAQTTSTWTALEDYFFVQDSNQSNYVTKTRKILSGDIPLSAFNDDIGAGTGDITAVNVSQGLYGGGTSGDVSIKPDWSGSADNTLYSYPARVTSIADDDIIPFHDDSHGTDRTITFANFKSTIGGDITGVTAGDGLSGGGSSGTVSLAVNVDDETLQITTDTVEAKTAAVINGGTSLATGDQIYDFVTGLGYTSNTGDITAVTAGDGLSGGATSGAATVDLGTPDTLTAATSNGTTATSHTHAITTTDAGTASTIVRTDASSNITANNFITTSDKRLKSNIEPIKEGLETLKKFVSYEYELNGKQDAGFIAQEVQEHIPYAVNEKEDGYLAMNTKPILAHIHKAILELDKRLSDIENKLN